MDLVIIAAPDEKGDPAQTARCTDEAFEQVYKARGYGTVKPAGDGSGALVWDVAPDKASAKPLTELAKGA